MNSRYTTPGMPRPNATQTAETTMGVVGGLWGFTGVRVPRPIGDGHGLSDWPSVLAPRQANCSAIWASNLPPRYVIRMPIVSRNQGYRPAWDQIFLFTMFKSSTSYLVCCMGDARDLTPQITFGEQSPALVDLFADASGANGRRPPPNLPPAGRTGA